MSELYCLFSRLRAKIYLMRSRAGPKQEFTAAMLLPVGRGGVCWVTKLELTLLGWSPFAD